MRVKKILVPMDVEQTSALALAYGRDLATLFGATMQVVHVIEDQFALRGGTELSVTSSPRLRSELEDCAAARISRPLLQYVSTVQPGCSRARVRAAPRNEDWRHR